MNKGSFKKNHIPWNTGKKVHLSPNSEWKKGHIPWSKGKKGIHHSEETKKKMSDNRRGKRIGKNNPHWKGGISSEGIRIRQTREYKLWRISVFERDNYTCRFCGKRGDKTRLNADHIKPFADYPELRFAIDNGRTLCKDCHKSVHKL